MYHASLLNGLASGAGAGEAMHTDLKEQRLGLGMVIKNIADYGGLGDGHIFIHSYSIILDERFPIPIYYNVFFVESQQYTRIIYRGVTIYELYLPFSLGFAKLGYGIEYLFGKTLIFGNLTFLRLLRYSCYIVK